MANVNKESRALQKFHRTSGSKSFARLAYQMIRVSSYKNMCWLDLLFDIVVKIDIFLHAGKRVRVYPES